MSEQKYSIARKAAKNESYYFNNPNSKKRILFTFSIESEINLNKQIDILDKAIYEWKLMHPFLRCYVMNKNVDSLVETYFVYVDDEKIKNSFLNVNLLNLDLSEKDETNGIFEETWKLLAEKELMTPLEFFSGNFLWRLTLFTVNESHSKDKYKYCILFTINHGICDGRTSYNCIIHLFQIIESIYKNEYTRQEPFKMYPGSEFYTDFIDEFQSDILSVPEIEIPNFYNQNIEEKCEFETNLEFFKNRYLLNEKININNGPEFVTIESLLENSKTNFSKFILSSFDESKTRHLLRLSKHYDVKLNSCLKSILSIAMIMLHSKFDTKLSTVAIVTPVDSRSYFMGKYGPENFQSIGVHADGFLSRFENQFDDLKFGDEKWIEKFWQLSKNDTDLIKQMIENKEFLKKTNFKKGVELKKMAVHFNFTNYGVLQNHTKKQVIQIKGFSSMVAFVNKAQLNFPLIILSNTINNQIYFTFRYNSALINKDIIDSLIEYTHQISDALLS
ncbi:unnamed protein product [Brachionus calyciflorus]|uniref:Condensation domain-containing protein n=1 Tax=Brachionus calyciflorus TaxID=104777 RepID=A0A814GWN8_9BILA|nr:unnamed protein product [Brachionus calyciflorus]